MLTAIDKMRHAQIWDLLSEYAAIREHLEDTFHSMCSLRMSFELELNDLSDDLDSLQEELSDVSLKLFRFKGHAPDDTDADATSSIGSTSDGPAGPDDQLLFFEDNSQDEDESPFPWEEDSK